MDERVCLALGMPLHAHDEPRVRALDSLDHPVGRDRRDPKAVGDHLRDEALVVTGVDRDRSPPVDALDQAAGLDADLVRVAHAGAGGAVAERIRHAGRNVGNELAGKRYVERLDSPADAEYGHALLQGFVDHLQLALRRAATRT